MLTWPKANIVTQENSHSGEDLNQDLKKGLTQGGEQLTEVFSVNEGTAMEHFDTEVGLTGTFLVEE